MEFTRNIQMFILLSSCLSKFFRRCTININMLLIFELSPNNHRGPLFPEDTFTEAAAASKPDRSGYESLKLRPTQPEI